MTRKYFGTDGIRGRANTPPMTAYVAMKAAMAASIVLHQEGQHNRVVIGKDTRLSCYMLEQAMASGFLAMGMEVMFTGPIPTPGVAFLTRSLRADLGVMISASHNPYQDNGIKFFGRNGYKLSDEIELQIEGLLQKELVEKYAPAEKMGRAYRIDDAAGRYVEYIKNTFPKNVSLKGKKIVIDCAHGAGYKVAPQILWELGADIIKINVDPNGKNINDKCGATDTKALQSSVVENGADLGVALDGDADRLIMVDETGTRINGDQLMALVGQVWQDKGLLSKPAIVSTIMSNLGLERFLASKDIKLHRAKVGDRYVMEDMRAHDLNFGGEQSGHLIFSDYATTGDGILAALQILAILQEHNMQASELTKIFTPVPQILQNVKYNRASDFSLEAEEIQNLLKQAEETLSNDGGRLVVRPSGTEPLIRVMAEGDDEREVQKIVADLCNQIESHAS